VATDLRSRIVAERERLGLSRSEAARRLHVSRQAYLQLECRTSDPRLSTLIKLCEIGMKLETLVPELCKTDGRPM
jgi:transcriptional regulator with XRE-family HTH domain